MFRRAPIVDGQPPPPDAEEAQAATSARARRIWDNSTYIRRVKERFPIVYSLERGSQPVAPNAPTNIPGHTQNFDRVKDMWLVNRPEYNEGTYRAEIEGVAYGAPMYQDYDQQLTSAFERPIFPQDDWGERAQPKAFEYEARRQYYFEISCSTTGETYVASQGEMKNFWPQLLSHHILSNYRLFEQSSYTMHHLIVWCTVWSYSTRPQRSDAVAAAARRANALKQNRAGFAPEHYGIAQQTPMTQTKGGAQLTPNDVPHNKNGSNRSCGSRGSPSRSRDGLVPAVR